MTTSHISASGRSRRFRFGDVALGLVLVVLVAALWLVFFSLFPFELVPPRVS